MAALYAASLINPKRPRLTRQELALMYERLKEITLEQRHSSVRQVYYQATVRGFGPKDELFYDRVDSYLIKMREKGVILWTAISDGTRWVRKPATHDSLAEALLETRQTYRRALWRGQKDYVEVYIEKDALASVVYEVTAEYDVPLMVCRGFPSLSFLHTAAQVMRATGKPAYVYYFGDWDPSGVAISTSLERRLREFGGDMELHFIRVAVNREQIEQLGLPTRETKKSDKRSKNWKGGDSCELDSIDANTLRRMVRDCIERHIDPQELEDASLTEQLERESYNRVVAHMPKTGDHGTDTMIHWAQCDMVKEDAPDLWPEVMSGELSLEDALKKVDRRNRGR